MLFRESRESRDLRASLLSTIVHKGFCANLWILWILWIFQAFLTLSLPLSLSLAGWLAGSGCLTGTRLGRKFVESLYLQGAVQVPPLLAEGAWSWASAAEGHRLSVNQGSRTSDPEGGQKNERGKMWPPHHHALARPRGGGAEAPEWCPRPRDTTRSMLEGNPTDLAQGSKEGLQHPSGVPRPRDTTRSITQLQLLLLLEREREGERARESVRKAPKIQRIQRIQRFAQKP